MIPITIKLIVTYPLWISIYRTDFRSKTEIIQKANATQPKPTKNPAIAPQEIVVFGSFKNIARLVAMINENKNVEMKIKAFLPFFKSSSRNLFSCIHCLPNNMGEYHKPPIKKFDTAATNTATKLMVEIFIL